MQNSDLTKNLGFSGLPKTWAWSNIDTNISDDEIKRFFERNRSHGITGLLPSGDNNFYERASQFAKESGIELREHVG